MKSVIRAMGNSQGVILPKPALEEAGLARGDAVEIEVREDTVILRKPRPASRAGWAQAASRLGDDEADRDWTGFGNADDEALRW